MKNCGEHCNHENWCGSRCILKPHTFGAHMYGTPPCESGSTIRYVDQETAAQFPPCGFAGILTPAERSQALADLSLEPSPSVRSEGCPATLN